MTGEGREGEERSEKGGRGRSEGVILTAFAMRIHLKAEEMPSSGKGAESKVHSFTDVKQDLTFIPLSPGTSVPLADKTTPKEIIIIIIYQQSVIN